MARNYLESLLIAEFEKIIKDDDAFGIRERINFGDDTPDYADVEYVALNGELLIIEAKSHETQDAPNTVYKLFGQLMKEQGKVNSFRKNNVCNFGVLIPDEVPENKMAPRDKGSNYYRRRFQEIPEKTFAQFGELVNSKYVFVCSRTDGQRYVKVFTWVGFYNNSNPIKIIA